MIQASSITPLELSRAPKPSQLRLKDSKATEPAVALQSGAISASHCLVLTDEIVRKGVVVEQEFEFGVLCRNESGTPVPVEPSRLSASVLRYPDECSIPDAMPITVRPEPSRPGLLIVRTMAAKSNSAFDALKVTITVAIDGTVITPQPITFTAVS